MLSKIGCLQQKKTELNIFIFCQVIAILSLKGKKYFFFLELISPQKNGNDSVNFQNMIIIFFLIVTDRPFEKNMTEE